MAYSTINPHKYGNCNCGCGGIDVAGRKVGKNFHCLNSYENIKKLEQLERQKQRNALRTDGRKLRGLVQKGQNDLLIGRNQLIQDLDAVVSRYVRILYANEKGEVKCYTCDTVKHFSLMQAGHFVKREHIGLRWDLRNLRPQDEYCNCYLYGNVSVYAKELEKEQKGLPDTLIEQSHTVEKPSNEELKTMLIDFRQKLKIVESKLNK